MTIRETIRAQQKSMKDKSFKEKLAFFWEYYALKTFALLVALAVLIAFIVSMLTQKAYIFTGYFFGADTQSSEEFLEAFAQSENIDLKDYALTVQTGPYVRMDQQISTEIYDSMEAFTAMVAGESVSCFAGSPDLFLYYAYLGYATDLRSILSETELRTLSPYLYYVDAQLIRQQEDSDGGYADAYWNRPDPTNPEAMEDPVPVGISLDAASADFQNCYHFTGESLIGICESTAYPETAKAFLRYCFSLES